MSRHTSMARWWSAPCRMATGIFSSRSHCPTDRRSAALCRRRRSCRQCARTFPPGSDRWPATEAKSGDDAMSEQAKQRMMATIAFSGEFGDPEWTNDPKFDIRLDVDAAAAELRQAWL